jgi:hypothetical protein
LFIYLVDGLWIDYFLEWKWQVNICSFIWLMVYEIDSEEKLWWRGRRWCGLQIPCRWICKNDLTIIQCLRCHPLISTCCFSRLLLLLWVPFPAQKQMSYPTIRLACHVFEDIHLPRPSMVVFIFFIVISICRYFIL